MIKNDIINDIFWVRYISNNMGRNLAIFLFAFFISLTGYSVLKLIYIYLYPNKTE